MNSVIKYPGAKWSVSSWTIGHFPQHHSYLEPFFGSGAVLFTKPRSNIETVNDLDAEVINLYEWIRSDPERLAKELYLIPYARDIYERAWKAKDSEQDSFKRAINFYARMMMGHGFRMTGERVGWKNDVQGREKSYASKQWCELPDVIFRAADRLRGVQIENRPAIELITRFNYSNVLIYADPPYVLSTRHGRQYRHEMTDKDHADLIDALKAHKGPALISGYECRLYDDLLRGWRKDSTLAYAQTATKRKEVLWMNFDPDAQMQIDLTKEVNV